MKISNCISILLCIILLFISIKYYLLKNDFYELDKKYIELTGKYAIELSNKESLKNSIELQNKEIEKYKQDSKNLSEKITELNNTIETYNSNNIQYENMDKDDSSEEAIQWLKEKALSL